MEERFEKIEQKKIEKILKSLKLQNRKMMIVKDDKGYLMYVKLVIGINK